MTSTQTNRPTAMRAMAVTKPIAPAFPNSPLPRSWRCCAVAYSRRDTTTISPVTSPTNNRMRRSW